ncbi:MAG: hypothetical protein LC109_11995 [Bacteroidia bacterium]|nr:hypothetical protein [Bacteroidia bacterium]
MMKLLLPLLFVFGLFLSATAQKTQGYEISFDANKNAIGFEVLDSSFRNKQVFFTGEDHRFIENNNEISLAFTKYLHQKFGVRHLLLELGYTWGKILNTYIQTGDSAIFEVIKKSSYISHYDYFNQLYFYNKSLPDSEKIIITGIDVTRDYTVCMHYLNYLIPRKPTPSDDIIVSVESIKALSEYLYDQSRSGDGYNNSVSYSYSASIDSIIANFHRYEDSYKTFLDTQYTEFAKIIKCLEDNEVWRNYDNNNMIQKFIFREQFMLKEFEKLYKQYPNDKFYGQFGRCHIGQTSDGNECEWYNFRPIATRISELNNNELKGKMMTLAIIYTDGLAYKDKLSDQINSLIAQTPKNSIYIYPYENNVSQTDSADFAPSKYNYVIIDNKSKLPVSYTDSGPVYTWKNLDKYKTPYTLIGYGRNFAMLPEVQKKPLNNLNQALGANPLFTDFKTPIISQTIYIDFINFSKKSGRGWGIDFSNDLAQTRDIDSVTTLRFGGMSANFRMHYLRKLFSVSEFGLWLNSSLRLGYDSKYLQIQYPDKSRPALLGFDNIATAKFKTASFNVIPTLGLAAFVFKSLMIGADCGYNWQTGKTSWKQGGNRVQGPSQKWSSAFYSLKMALIFN